MVDVTGIEPATPWLQSRSVQNAKCFVCHHLQEIGGIFRSLKCTGLYSSREVRCTEEFLTLVKVVQLDDVYKMNPALRLRYRNCFQIGRA